MEQSQTVGSPKNLLSYHTGWVEHYDEVFNRIYWKNTFHGQVVEVNN